jgi:hypothetical protein
MRRLLICTLLAVTARAQTPADPPMEQTKKNIKVLAGVPSSQLIPIMTVMANSLGVTCAYCHETAWESDAKPPKEAGRRMIRLVRSINDAHYDGRTVVTCNTCHRGHTTTVDVPSLIDAGYHRVAESSILQPALRPADEIFAEYRRAWGTPEALAAVQTRTSRGVATGRSGRGDARSAPFEMLQAKPNRVEIKLDLPYPPQADRELAHQFFNQLGIRERYLSVRTVGVEHVRGRDAYVVEGMPTEGGRPERLFFDAANFVLLRRDREAPTLVGPLPESYEFDDYRTVDGVLVPFLLRWSRGDYEVTHRFADVRHNATTSP